MALSVADLAGMQATMVESMPDTCTLVIDTLTSDAAGGQTATPSAPVTVACRVGPLRLTRSSADAEILETGRVIPQSLWVFSFPHGTVVSSEHRVTHAGRDFEVVEVLSPRTYDLNVRASCRLVNEGRG